MTQLKEKVAIVTGAGRGIGRAIALALSEQGAEVVLAARSEDEIEAVANEVPTRALAVHTDVSDPVQIQHLVDRAISEFGRLDLLVNNAGIAFQRSVQDTTQEEWDHIMHVNLRSAFLACKAVLPQMKLQKAGKIINITAGSGSVASLNFSAYSASKAGLIMLTECLALEMKPFNIDVNAIAVGRTHTRMADELAGGIGNVGYQPELMMRPEDIAPIAVFLASDESRSMTGANIFARKHVRPGYYGEGNLPPHAY